MGKQGKVELSFEEALLAIANQIEHKEDPNNSKIKIGSFFEFIRDIWSQGYEHPRLFNVWHVEQICNDAEEAMRQQKKYVAVLPRYHLKSTVLGYGFSVWRGLKFIRETRREGTGLYLSFSDGMSRYHIAEIKKFIRSNPVLSEVLKDKAPQGDFTFRYEFEGVRFNILNGGLFSFKRGIHCNLFLIADDILKDPENPLNFSQLKKIEEHFLTESINIPLLDAPTNVLGTPMAPDDLLAKLQVDERFISRVLPALDPIPGKRVLMPERYNEEWLLAQQKANYKAFATEFMLVPLLSTESYFNNEEITVCEDPSLISLDPYTKHQLDSEFTVAGFDIGKKRHPSHLSIFITKNEKPVQVCQIFLDNWTYTAQVDFLNQVAENFHIDKGYIDNTRGEIEERGLNTVWRPLSFTAKSKRTMAQDFEEYVNGKKVSFIANARQKAQIICVDNNLQAPETPLGHGDAFWSNALALLAHHETFSERTVLIGNMNEFTSVNKTEATSFAVKVPREYNSKDLSSCPQCGETRGWIPENKLCLICMKKF